MKLIEKKNFFGYNLKRSGHRSKIDKCDCMKLKSSCVAKEKPE
jgi:hypothetical protein